MIFTQQDGKLIIEDGTRKVASTSSHILEINSNGYRLTFGAYNFEFAESDIAFDDLVKMLPG